MRVQKKIMSKYIYYPPSYFTITDSDFNEVPFESVSNLSGTEGEHGDGEIVWRGGHRWWDANKSKADFFMGRYSGDFSDLQENIAKILALLPSAESVHKSSWYNGKPTWFEAWKLDKKEGGHYWAFMPTVHPKVTAEMAAAYKIKGVPNSQKIADYNDR